MRATIYTPRTVFASEAAAAKVANANAADDADWEYRVVVDPSGSGKAVIHLYDEDKNFVGIL
jgi:hypothetical protein